MSHFHYCMPAGPHVDTKEQGFLHSSSSPKWALSISSIIFLSQIQSISSCSVSNPPNGYAALLNCQFPDRASGTWHALCPLSGRLFFPTPLSPQAVNEGLYFRPQFRQHVLHSYLHPPPDQGSVLLLCASIQLCFPLLLLPVNAPHLFDFPTRVAWCMVKQSMIMQIVKYTTHI